MDSGEIFKGCNSKCEQGNSVTRDLPTGSEAKGNWFRAPPPPPPLSLSYPCLIIYTPSPEICEENMEWNISKIPKKYKQHHIHIKHYTAYLHDMVHIPAKFREKYGNASSKHDRQTHRRTNKTRQTGHFNISHPRPLTWREIKTRSTRWMFKRGRGYQFLNLRPLPLDLPLFYILA